MKDKVLIDSILEKKKAVRKNLSILSHELEASLKRQKEDFKAISKEDPAYFIANEEDTQKDRLNEYGREIKKYIHEFVALINAIVELSELETHLEKFLERETENIVDSKDKHVQNIALLSKKVKKAMSEFVNNYASDGIFKKGQLIALISYLNGQVYPEFDPGTTKNWYSQELKRLNMSNKSLLKEKSEKIFKKYGGDKPKKLFSELIKVSETLLKWSTNKRLRHEIAHLRSNIDLEVMGIKKLVNILKVSRPEFRDMSNDFVKEADGHYHLKTYEEVFSSHIRYLDNLREIKQKAIDYMEKMIDKYPGTRDSIKMMHASFNKKMEEGFSGMKVTPAEVKKWWEILNNLKKDGLVVDKDPIGVFLESGVKRGIEYIKEKLETKFFRNYVSVLCILLEELRNLDMFSGVAIKEEDKPMYRAIKELISTTKYIIECELIYVPLFVPYNEYDDIRVVDRELVNPLYKNLKIEKNHIIEIVSYGFRTERGEDEEKDYTRLIIVD